jgi:MFS superfamily sulfate permease-like transporter
VTSKNKMARTNGSHVLIVSGNLRRFLFVGTLVMDFTSYAVLKGFTLAAGLTVALGQFKVSIESLFNFPLVNEALYHITFELNHSKSVC